MSLLRKLRAAALLATALTGVFLSTAGPAHAETVSGAAAASGRLVIACNCECSW